MYGSEIEEPESRGRISEFQHFIRQARLFATEGYCFGAIEIGIQCFLGGVVHSLSFPNSFFFFYIPSEFHKFVGISGGCASVRNAPLSPESQYIPISYCFLSFFGL